MSADENGTEFIENSGILEMADANNIVALFPQVKLKKIIIFFVKSIIAILLPDKN